MQQSPFSFFDRNMRRFTSVFPDFTPFVPWETLWLVILSGNLQPQLTSLMSLFPTMVLNSLRSFMTPLRISAMRFLWWLLTSRMRDSSASKAIRWPYGRRGVRKGGCRKDEWGCARKQISEREKTRRRQENTGEWWSGRILCGGGWSLRAL